MLKINYLMLLIGTIAVTTSCDRQSPSEENAIRAADKSYEKAFNQRDAKALSELWVEDSRYVIPETGDVIEGRKAIEEWFEESFKEHSETQLDINTKSITFPTSTTAIEQATATLKQNGNVIEESAYKAVYEKINDKWLLKEVREVPFSGPAAPSEHLQALDWLIGNWVDEDEDVTIASTYHWNRYKNFLAQEFSVTVEGSFEIEGKEIIGWDPINKNIRSWLFDSDGGFGQATWKKQDKSWVIEASQTLADGRNASSINIITPIDHDKFTWQSTGRTVGGELLPDIEPVTVVRRK